MIITKYIDSFLNKTPMYKLVMYILMTISFFAFIESLFGKVPFTLPQLGESLILTLFICVVLNFVFAKILKLPLQYESSIITGLILFLTLSPIDSASMSTSLSSGFFYALVIASCIAIISKYVLVFRNTHIFNPAALGIYAVTLFNFGANFWWVGNLYLLPVVLILGILIIRKTRRTTLILSAIVGSLIGMALDSYMFQTSISGLLITNYISGPMIFFFTIMLTEPHTITKNKNQQIFYGLFVTLFIPIIMLCNFAIFPPLDLSLSLLLANLISFFLSQRQRLILKLKSVTKLSEDMSEFSFENANGKPINFKAGEFMEVVVPGNKTDSRGSRRYFTISSASANEVAFATKFPEKNESAWKNNLKSLQIGDTVYATQFGGDFLLPKNKNINLALIAGGIGVTPFIAQIRYLLAKKENRNITLFYCIKFPKDMVYLDLFKQAMAVINLRVVFVISEKIEFPKDAQQNFFYETGYMTMEILNKYLQDMNKTQFYISGPNVMVDMLKNTLHGAKVKNSNIHTDYFPGF